MEDKSFRLDSPPEGPKGVRNIAEQMINGSLIANSGKSRALIVAACCLVAGLIITGIVTIGVRNSTSTDARREFESSAKQTTGAVTSAIEGYATKLRDIGAFMANSEAMSPEQFHAYIQSSKVFEQIPSFSSLFYLRRVEEADLDAAVAEEEAANPKFSLFRLGESQPGQMHLLLTQYEPGSIDLNFPIGTDTSTIPSVAALINLSAETGDAVVGSFGADPLIAKIAEDTNFPLVQALLETDFFIGVPIYGPAADGANENQPPVGWSAAIVNDFAEVAGEATAGLPDSLGISLEVDLTATDFANSDDIARVASQDGNAGPRDNAAFVTTESVRIDGVDWKISLWSTAGANNTPLSVYLIFAAGIAGSILASAFMYARIRAHARERVFALEAADRAQFQRDILDSVTNAMVVLGSDGRILDANPAWLQLHDANANERADGKSAEKNADSTIGRRYIDVLSSSLRVGNEDLVEGLNDVLGGVAPEAEADIAVEVGSRRSWYAARATRLRGRSGGAVVMHADITERKRTHDELELKASRDNLTGLLNRAAFNSEVDLALVRARSKDEGVAILFIDLDGFKPINDTYGHAVGDDVLRAVAQRITGAVRTTDRVARLGGDEFVVLMAPLKDQETAKRTAERILEVLGQPVRIGGRAIPIAASIGIASVESPLSDDPARLIERADHAMYKAKQSGGSRAEVL